MKNNQQNRTVWNEKFLFSFRGCDFRTRDMRIAYSILGSKDAVRDAAARHWARHDLRVLNASYIAFSFPRALAVVRDWKNNGLDNYTKIFFRGNKHIYLASPIYGHRDYNKSLFCSNTAENWEKCKILNRLFEKLTNKKGWAET